jgi:hypothetical protein
LEGSGLNLNLETSRDFLDFPVPQAKYIKPVHLLNMSYTEAFKALAQM